MSAASKPPSISVAIEESGWRKDKAALRLMRRAVRLALVLPPHPALARATARSGEVADPAVTLLLTTDAKLRSLNAAFRGKDKPTNVLSFPAAGALSYLGDVALAFGVVQREARAQGKAFADHAAHLALHGTLHLLGYDHEAASEARIMEAIERKLLERLGIADPYASRSYSRLYARRRGCA